MLSLIFHRSSLLKRVCASCWLEQDAEECGWLEPFEARICLSRILDSLQETATLVQLAALIAPQIETQAETTAQHAAAAAPHSHAAAAPSSPFQVELEQDLRAHLAKLLAEFRRPGAIEQEFLLFLEHIEARPAQQPHSFTPPVGQKRGSSNHSPKAHANGSVASTLSSSSSLQSSPPPSAISNSSSSQQEEMKDGPPPPAASPSFPPFSSSSSSSSLNLDRKVFRYEFNTAVVLWLESQITKRMFQIEQNNGAGQQA